MIAKQEFNGKRGEARTSAILLDRFWVLQRSVDVEGADCLVQLTANSLQELTQRKNKIQAIGIVQSKFFEGRNQVKIKKEYVIDNGKPSLEFFALLHTDDENGNEVHYFFSSEEIVENFYLNSQKDHYCFSITNERKYSEFKNIAKKKLLDRIETAILTAEIERNTKFVNALYSIFMIPTQHYQDHPNFIYKLRELEGHSIVLCEDQTKGNRHLLEYRRDLFNNLGSFSWGYIGTGTYFLSVCILAHHLNGHTPTEELVLKLQHNLIGTLDTWDEHDITSSEIQKAIGTNG
ncbi:hypothetical protein L4D04_15575 [Photobacterium angustum]|uniref:Uncharacterized protein n=1 Tax=Photobacterium angustum (strain S14 / CCUG 15956) TaxID=314292 RepID=Q1ZQ29_PHOAS|nr:DUF6166 domain-containing protein [Photobacterium angustum]EAS64468.1 hypothetical protein VAS14_02081 [Photobacterium angustum S14]